MYATATPSVPSRVSVQSFKLSFKHHKVRTPKPGLSVNIIGWKAGIYPLHVSKQECRAIELLLLTDPNDPEKTVVHELAPSQCVAHLYCDQTAGWMKLVLGMIVGLSPGDFVLDGEPPPSPKRGGGPLPNFGPNSIVAKWLDASRCHLV